MKLTPCRDNNNTLAVGGASGAFVLTSTVDLWPCDHTTLRVAVLRRSQEKSKDVFRPSVVTAMCWRQGLLHMTKLF